MVICSALSLKLFCSITAHHNDMDFWAVAKLQKWIPNFVACLAYHSSEPCLKASLPCPRWTLANVGDMRCRGFRLAALQDDLKVP